MTVERNWRRIVAGLVGTTAAINGLLMLVGPQTWYSRVPGVTETGPFNPHFVLDIGFAFAVAGLGLILFCWSERHWSAGLIGALFLGLHGLLHTTMIVRGTTSTVKMELALVVFPAIAALAAIWPQRTTPH